MRLVLISVIVFAVSLALQSGAMAQLQATVQTNGIECVSTWGPTSVVTYSTTGIFNSSTTTSADVMCPLTRASQDSDTTLDAGTTFKTIYIYLTNTTTAIRCDTVWLSKTTGSVNEISPPTYAIDLYSLSGTRMTMTSGPFTPDSASVSESLYCTLPPRAGILGLVTTQTLLPNSDGAAAAAITPFPMY